MNADPQNKKTEPAAASPEAAIAPDMAAEPETLTLKADPDRQRRLLWLARSLNKRNILPDSLCHTGFILYVCLQPVSLLFWGAGFQNRSAVLLSWQILTLGLALLVLLAEYARSAFGLPSWLHRFRAPVLTLEPARLIFEMTRHTMGRRASGSSRWTLPYRDIRRMEYDRASKTLRIFGLFDTAECRLPNLRAMPAGMCRQDFDQPSAERNQFIDLPMFFDRPDKLLNELQNRTGHYIHPAVRGDDMIEMRDLPGLKRDRSRVRPLGALMLLFTLLTFVSALLIGVYFQRNPLEPFPRTEVEYLQQAFGVGDTVTLDGCEITLMELARIGRDNAGNVSYSLLMTFLNHNSPYITVRVEEAYRTSLSNITLSARKSDGSTAPVPITGPPRGYVGLPQEMPPRLESGRSTNVKLFFVMPEDVEDMVLAVNSDYWPPRSFFRDVHYTGGYVNVGGHTIKDNEIRFRLDRALF